MQNNYLSNFFSFFLLYKNIHIFKSYIEVLKNCEKNQEKKSNKTEAKKAASKYVIHIDQKHITRNAAWN